MAVKRAACWSRVSLPLLRFRPLSSVNMQADQPKTSTGDSLFPALARMIFSVWLALTLIFFTDCSGPGGVWYIFFSLGGAAESRGAAPLEKRILEACLFLSFLTSLATKVAFWRPLTR